MLLALTVLWATVTLPAAGEVNLFGWSEYVPQEVLDGFTKETGIKVNFESYASNEEMLSKLVAGAAPTMWSSLLITPPKSWSAAECWRR